MDANGYARNIKQGFITVAVLAFAAGAVVVGGLWLIFH